MTYFGTGAPYLLACMKAGLRPGAEHDLSRLRGIGSTGSPLPPEGFRWVYDAVVAEGQELHSRLVLRRHRPVHRVRRALPAAPGAGRRDLRAVPGRGGRGVRRRPASPVIGEVGELVITAPMPSMPVGFWNDPGR